MVSPCNDMKSDEEGAIYVHDSAVNVAEFLEPEQAGPVGAVIEDIACRSINWHCSCVGCRIRGLSVDHVSLLTPTLMNASVTDPACN